MVDPEHRANSLRREERDEFFQRRSLARERRKVIGLIGIAVLILVLALLRFGSTIPWGAR